MLHLTLFSLTIKPGSEKQMQWSLQTLTLQTFFGIARCLTDETWRGITATSPLNRYSQVQRQLVEIQGNQRVTAKMELEINDQPCQLLVQVQP